MPAIYYQIISAAKEEFAIVSKCLVREKFMQELKELIMNMDMTKDQPTDKQLLQSFKLFIDVRNSTIDLLRAIGIWQQCFTKLKRPQLMEKDYLVGMISDADYFSNSKARKYFNFMLGRGNILLLPRTNVLKKPPVEVTQELSDLIYKFANPSTEDIRESYQVMINSLSPRMYRQLYSANDWLAEQSWVPAIVINYTNKNMSLDKQIEAVASPKKTILPSIANTSKLNNEDILNAIKGAVNAVSQGKLPEHEVIIDRLYKNNIINILCHLILIITIKLFL